MYLLLGKQCQEQNLKVQQEAFRILILFLLICETQYIDSNYKYRRWYNETCALVTQLQQLSAHAKLASSLPFPSLVLFQRKSQILYIQTYI